MLLPVERGPGQLGGALAVDVHLAALLAQEQVLLRVRAHEQHATARVDPQAAEAAQRGLQHHGCIGVGGDNRGSVEGGEGEKAGAQCAHTQACTFCLHTHAGAQHTALHTRDGFVAHQAHM